MSRDISNGIVSLKVLEGYIDPSSVDKASDATRLLGSGSKDAHVDLYIDMLTGKLFTRWNRKAGDIQRLGTMKDGTPIEYTGQAYLASIYRHINPGELSIVAKALLKILVDRAVLETKEAEQMLYMNKGLKEQFEYQSKLRYSTVCMAHDLDPEAVTHVGDFAIEHMLRMMNGSKT